MPGTNIKGLKFTKVIDCDTVKVEIDGKVESLRLACLDTEESWAGGSKPVTNAGKLASSWAKEYFGVEDDGFPAGGAEIKVDIEFDIVTGDTESDREAVFRQRPRICLCQRQGESLSVK